MPTVSSYILKRNYYTLKSPFINQISNIHYFRVYFGFSHFNLLLLNQQTVVQFYRCKTKQTTSGSYSYKNLLTQVQILPLFTKWSEIKYSPPQPILTGFFHNTLHTLILAMLIAPFVYYLKSRRFHFSHYVDS